MSENPHDLEARLKVRYILDLEARLAQAETERDDLQRRNDQLVQDGQSWLTIGRENDELRAERNQMRSELEDWKSGADADADLADERGREIARLKAERDHWKQEAVEWEREAQTARNRKDWRDKELKATEAERDRLRAALLKQERDCEETLRLHLEAMQRQLDAAQQEQG